MKNVDRLYVIYCSDGMNLQAQVTDVSSDESDRSIAKPNSWESLEAEHLWSMRVLHTPASQWKICHQSLRIDRPPPLTSSGHGKYTVGERSIRVRNVLFLFTLSPGSCPCLVRNGNGKTLFMKHLSLAKVHLLRFWTHGRPRTFINGNVFLILCGNIAYSKDDVRVSGESLCPWPCPG